MQKMFIKALLPIIAFILVVAGFRMAVNRVVDEATKPSAAFPVTTPFVSPMCPNVQDCTWKGIEYYNPQQQRPFRGLQNP